MDSLILVKSLAIVAAILALIYACFLIVKRRELSRSGSHKRLLVVEYQRIDLKNSLCLIKADTQEYLVVLGPTSTAIYPHSPRN